MNSTKCQKASSLVFSFIEQLRSDGALDAPEPDFLKWECKALYADVATAGDGAAWEKLPADERAAWRLFSNALEATGNLLDLYKTNPLIFQKVASQLSFLPCLASWHPDAERFNRQLLEFSNLGRKSMYGELRQNARHIVRQSWPVRYAYAIMATIDLTLDTYEDRLPLWAQDYGYGVKHPIPLGSYVEAMQKLGWDQKKQRRELPKYQGMYQILPAWTKRLDQLRRPFKEDHVLDYWRVGKEIILEEMPSFHLRSEWKDYHRRNYKAGGKDGVIKHAIFKDILAALRTIAGSNKLGSAKQ